MRKRIENNSKIDKNNHVLISLHMPKTGGTTLESILQGFYRPETIFRTEPERHWESIHSFRELPVQKRIQYELIMGHMRFGLHEHTIKPASYITMIRNPIDRIISYYYYILSYPKHYLHDQIKKSKMTISQVVMGGISKEFDNFQTRRISGFDDIEYKGCTTEILDQAKNNIEKHFTVVGLTEFFNETLILLTQKYGYRFPLYVKRNVTKNKPSLQHIQVEELNVIKQYNELDIVLYDYVKERIRQQILSFGSIFPIQLKIFNFLNYLYGQTKTFIQAAR
jgi:hypothetical protein